MTSKQFTTTVLTPADGMYLTQKGDVEISQRIIARTVALDANDSPDNWREITQAEADAYRAAQDKAAEEALNNAEAEMPS